MQAWLQQFFHNPGLILPWGVALVSAPIIIHLINRLRFRRVRFAAMEFLLASEERNRRRLLFEQLLLLLLRILLVAALLALLGRLVLDPAQMSIFRGAKTQHLVLLDDSGSMLDRWGETTAFDEAKQVVRKLASEGTRRPDTQRLTLVLLSRPDEPLFAQRDINDEFLNELETRLENLECSHRAGDLIRGLQAAGKLLEQDPTSLRQLHLVSDFRQSDWSAQSAAAQTAESLSAAGIVVNLVRTVPERHENLAIADLTGDVQVAVTGVPIRLKANVVNYGETVATNVGLSVLLDGRKLPMTVQFEKLEPGADDEREFDVTVTAPGKHEVRVALDVDSLSADNERFLALDVADRNRVLIVDSDPAGTAGAYVADALAADASLTGIAPAVIGVDDLRRQALGEFHCIYLLNVPELPADAVEALTDFAAEGGGLAWFVGGLAKPAFYNGSLYAAGKGIFPVPLGASRRELARPELADGIPDLAFTDHPIFRIFQGQDNPFVDSVRVNTYLPVDQEWTKSDDERRDGVRTLAVLRDGAPLIFEHRVGAGRVVTCLTSADASWSDWARNPSYVIFQLELCKYLTPARRALERRGVGEPIRVAIDPASFSETVEITAPDPTSALVTRIQAAPPAPGDGATEGDAAAVRLVASYPDTDRPGIYRVTQIDLNQAPHENWIAYNVPSDEGNLALANSSDIYRQFGAGDRVHIQEPGEFAWIQGQDADQDVRNVLLAGLIVLLIAEQALAYKMSYHPKPVGAAA